MPSLQEVLDFRKTMYDRSMSLVAKKGADYNRDQQANGGDTLFNIRVAELMGIVPTAERGILVRLSDKFMRLVSLVHPDRTPAVADESVLDTIADIHNYVDYLAMLHTERCTVKKAGQCPNKIAEAFARLEEERDKIEKQYVPSTTPIGEPRKMFGVYNCPAPSMRDSLEETVKEDATGEPWSDCTKIRAMTSQEAAAVRPGAVLGSSKKA